MLKGLANVTETALYALLAVSFPMLWALTYSHGVGVAWVHVEYTPFDDYSDATVETRWDIWSVDGYLCAARGVSELPMRFGRPRNGVTTTFRWLSGAQRIRLPKYLTRPVLRPGFGIEYSEVTFGRDGPDEPAYRKASGGWANAQLRIALWLPATLAALPLCLRLLRQRRRRLLRQGGRCPKCEYDSRATPSRCPECGQVDPLGSRSTWSLTHPAKRPPLSMWAWTMIAVAAIGLGLFTVSALSRRSAAARYMPSTTGESGLPAKVTQPIYGPLVFESEREHVVWAEVDGERRVLGETPGSIDVPRCSLWEVGIYPPGVADSLSELHRYRPPCVTVSVSHAPVAASDWTSFQHAGYIRALTFMGPIEAQDLALLPQMPNVSSLLFIDARVSPEGMSQLRRLEGLEKLEFMDSGVNDDHVRVIALSCPRLESLYLTDSDVSDACLAYIAKLPRLVLLDVRYTAVTEAAVKEVRRLRPNLAVRY